ncbi:hypothetical protein CERZMDRAFT_80180 [Cercospora zeae-maydis SCOH1-5]|uniref:Uncharacterized protein n=1 Tax=Cercospora zeae-maydis SCOH1-5 TaxID=717836 RepID=A0A6A6FVZ8_9PEZI|nr:hypothetical protein CERZMDRAFT_80180 [Cercospora zeae-maydis SCOH1-5]
MTCTLQKQSRPYSKNQVSTLVSHVVGRAADGYSRKPPDVFVHSIGSVLGSDMMKRSLFSFVAIGLSSIFALPTTGHLPDDVAFPLLERKDAHLGSFGGLPAFACNEYGDTPARIMLHASGEDDKMNKTIKGNPVADKLRSQYLQHLGCSKRPMGGSKAYSKRQSPKIELVALENMLTRILDAILRPPSAGPSSLNEAPSKTERNGSTESADALEDNVEKRRDLKATNARHMSDGGGLKIPASESLLPPA